MAIIKLPLSIKYRESKIASHPEVNVDSTLGVKILGGGAHVDWKNAGNILTANAPIVEKGSDNILRPIDWYAKSKDHGVASLASLTAWAICLLDPNNEWDVICVEATSSVEHHPSVEVKLPDDYTLTGIGAKANWSREGSLLTRCRPTDDFRGCYVQSKDLEHTSSARAEKASITAYAIGIKSKNDKIRVESQISIASSNTTQFPEVSVGVAANHQLTGGGASADWRTSGSYLTTSCPDLMSDLAPTGSAWKARAKDHHYPEACALTVYAIGIQATEG